MSHRGCAADMAHTRTLTCKEALSTLQETVKLILTTPPTTIRSQFLELYRKVYHACCMTARGEEYRQFAILGHQLLTSKLDPSRVSVWRLIYVRDVVMYFDAIVCRETAGWMAQLVKHTIETLRSSLSGRCLLGLDERDDLPMVAVVRRRLLSTEPE